MDHEYNKNKVKTHAKNFEFDNKTLMNINNQMTFKEPRKNTLHDLVKLTQNYK